MWKRLMGILLAFGMLMVMTPAMPEDLVIIAGTAVTETNRGDVLGDGTVRFAYDAANDKGTLTLSGARLMTEEAFPIEACGLGTLEIVLLGENRIRSNDYTCIAACKLIFSGSGSLEVVTEGRYNWCVDCTDGMTVNGGCIKITSVDYAICLDGTLAVNGGELTLAATDESGKAIDAGREDPSVQVGEDMVLLTDRDPNGANAAVTAVSDAAVIKAARYVRVCGKNVPITYEPGTDGMGTGTVQNKTYGTDCALYGEIFYRDGYEQTGWAAADGGEKLYDLGGTYAGNEAVTLYPVWAPVRYAIRYELDGGTAEGNPGSYTIETESFTLNDPVKDGYTFTGWSGSGLDGEENRAVTIERGSTGDRSYTAHWRRSGGGYIIIESGYTIEAAAGANGSISPSGRVSVQSGGEQRFTITPDSGYTIADVRVDGRSVGAVSTYTFRNISRGHTIEASFMKGTANPQTGAYEGYPGGIGIRAGAHTALYVR